MFAFVWAELRCSVSDSSLEVQLRGPDRLEQPVLGGRALEMPRQIARKFANFLEDFAHGVR